jgi:hypothetical protein
MGMRAGPLLPVLVLIALLPGSSAAQANSTLCRFTNGPRAGQIRLDTVDASAVDTSLVGHSYYGDNRAVLADLFYLLRNGAPPRFGLEPRAGPQGSYGTFRP